VVTHNQELASMMPRCLRMLDGGGLEELSRAERPAASMAEAAGIAADDIVTERDS
jgi:ABC-type lipoprotein export system ATPase subunit